MNNDEYIHIRKAGVKLNEKMIKAHKSEMVKTSAKLLGMMGDDDIIVMDDEEDISIILDFSFCEAIHNKKSGVDIFLDSNPSLSGFEKETCNALLGSYTSFFKVQETFPKEGTISLWDLLNKKEFLLKDINMSKTVYPGLILFCRILELNGMSMTSGIGFIFAKHSEQALLRHYRRELCKVGYPDEKVARFITAYKMKLTLSDPVAFEDI